MSAPVSSLGYALLGLLEGAPLSGYDLRRIFAQTAMKTYSDSPGAIYPALKKLERQALVQGRVEKGSGLRRRRLYRPTPRGREALRAWLRRPVNREDVSRGLQELMLRFAFSEPVLGRAASVRLLDSLEAEIAAYLPSLREQLAGLKASMPLSGRLAFESGLRTYESLLEWSRYARAAFRKMR